MAQKFYTLAQMGSKKTPLLKSAAPRLPSSPSRRPRILLAVTTWQGYRRENIAGALQYARRQTQWEFLPQWLPAYDAEAICRFPEADGLLFGSTSEDLAEAVRATGKPAVCIGDGRSGGMPAVVPHQRAIGEMAFTYFRERGFTHVGVCGVRQGVSPAREAAFRDAAEQAGVTCFHHCPEGLVKFGNSSRAILDAWGDWLADLPKPIALLCPRSVSASEICFACDALGILVPEEAAVLGVGSNDLQCELCTPPLSTIDPGSHRMGFEAAALLDRLLQGDPPPAEPIQIEPTGVIERRSTDTLAIEDPLLAQAVRTIRDRACEGLKIRELLECVPISRRSLEMGIRRTLGRTVREEILRIRLARARELLTRTDLAMPEIAARCGFSYASHLNRLFKLHTGQTPTAYRAERRHTG